jgi:hypothetical protein
MGPSTKLAGAALTFANYKVCSLRLGYSGAGSLRGVMVMMEEETHPVDSRLKK